MHVSVTDLLRAAVERGVITRDQRDALRTLESELAAGERTASATSSASERDAEATRGFNAVSIAYWAGALLVVFAFGWFLAERWRNLGASGVLAVAAVYVALFALVARTLGDRGFRVASGFAWVLVVVMTPVWTWALLTLAGEWPDRTTYYDMRWDNAWMASRWMILELATVGVGLVLLRRARFSALALPIAAALAGFALHTGDFFLDPELRRWTSPPWTMLVGVALLALAYAVERRQERDEDYAIWFYTAGLLVTSFAWMTIWDNLPIGRHLLPFAAVGLLSASLYLRRRSLLVAGAVWGIAYLGYLAFDVFEQWLGFPVVLATFGLVVLIGTVWLQKRYPSLVTRVNRGADPGERPSLPYATPIFAGLLVVAVATLAVAATGAPERLLRQQERQREQARQRPAPAVPLERPVNPPERPDSQPDRPVNSQERPPQR